MHEMFSKKIEDLTVLVDHIATHIWYLKDARTYGAANKAHADFFGCTSKELINRDMYEFLKNEEADICVRGNLEVFEKREIIHTEEWLCNKNNEKRLFHITKSPKLRKDCSVEYVVCSAEDITEKRILEQELAVRGSILNSIVAFTQELMLNDNLSEAINKGLSSLGPAVHVDRVYYWENEYHIQTNKWYASQKSEWCREGIEPQIDNPMLEHIPFEKGPDFVKSLFKGKEFIAHIRNLARTV